jgi:hypothetical protein
MEAHGYSRRQNLTPVELVDLIGVSIPQLEI